MLPRPSHLPPASRAGFGLALLLVALAMSAGSAAALDVEVAGTHERGGYVWADVRLDEPFSPRVEESLSRGMPATLGLHAELWRRRSAWFDRLVNSFDAELRIRFDVWSRSYRLERRGVPPTNFASLDSLAAALARPVELRVGRVGQLDYGARYYVAVVATLKPLNVEDVEEMEGWLSGEVEKKRGFGIITELPRSVFDAVRNFAGFGDQKARAMSPDFELRTLFSDAAPGSGR